MNYLLLANHQQTLQEALLNIILHPKLAKDRSTIQQILAKRIQASIKDAVDITPLSSTKCTADVHCSYPIIRLSCSGPILDMQIRLYRFCVMYTYGGPHYCR